MAIETSAALTAAGPASYVGLFNRSYGGDSKLSADYLRWQYIDNPDGQVIGADAIEDGKLAAHYAIIPRRFWFAGEEVLGALSVNTATDPAFQGRGLFTKLAHETYAAAVQKGVRFVVGVANANSIGGFVRKLGFGSYGSVRLALGTLPARESEGSLRTARTDQWWKWRLANPSRVYSYARSGDELIIQSRVRGVRFNLGKVASQSVPTIAQKHAGRTARFALTPEFPGAGRRIRVPARLQPSPWHLILLSLCDTSVAEFARAMHVWGIDMDTF